MVKPSGPGWRRHLAPALIASFLLVCSLVGVPRGAGRVPTAAAATETPPDAACVVDVSNITAWWRGEDGPTAEIGPSVTPPAGYADAVVGRGFVLAPPRVVSAAGVPAVTDGVTVETWVRVIDTAQTQALVSRWHSPGAEDQRSFALLVATGRLLWWTDETTTRRPVELSAATPQLFDGRFHHVAGTWSRTEIGLFVDGRRVASAPSPGGILNPATATSVQLGSAARSGFFVGGTIDEPAIHRVALPASTIAAIHAAGGAGKCGRGSTPPTPPTLPAPGPGTVGHLADLPGHNVPATALREHLGDLVTSHDGQVVEGMHVHGAVIVKHRDVTIRRNRVQHGVWVLPDTTHPAVSANVEWNTIGHERGEDDRFVAGNGRGQNVRYYRNEVFGGIDLFNFYSGGNVSLQENWAYGTYQWLSDPFQNGGYSHNDGIQVHMGGSRYHVLRNRFDLFLFRGHRWENGIQVELSPRPTARSNLGRFTNVAPMTTGFLFQQTNGRLDDIVFDGNRIDGDYYRVMSFAAGPYAGGPTNVRIVNNTIVRRTSAFGRNQLIGASTPGNIVFANNVDQTGTQIPRPRGMRAS